jgi:hypothetical protein
MTQKGKTNGFLKLSDKNRTSEEKVEIFYACLQTEAMKAEN